MTDLRRSILWVIFGFSMILLWDQWQIYNGKSATFFPTPTTQKATASAGNAPTGDGTPTAALGTTPGAASAPADGSASAPNAPIARELYEVSTDVLRLTFDSQGGSLVRADLLQYANALGGRKAGDFEPLTLISPAKDYAAQTGLVDTSASKTKWPDHTTPMRLVSSATQLAEGQDELQVRFESAPVSGVVLTKTYTLRRGQYAIGVQMEVSNQGQAAVQPQAYMQLVRDNSSSENQTPFYSTFTGPVVYSSAAKYQKVEFADIDKGKAQYEKQADDGYVAMVQHYFTSAWLLGDGIARNPYADRITVGQNNRYRVGMLTTLPSLAPGQSETLDARLFVGPQDEKLLERTATGLELVKDYGWLTILAKPLYWLMEKIHGFVGNWGWSIVLLVVAIKAAFYWLNATAYRSMAKMKAVNPRIMEMRERLKNNPQQMQQEMMKMYREEKVNPLGGCLPMLVQIPVFIALYWVLSSSVEMRNAPWIGWITDLSSRDPYFILPLIMTLTTVVQTALNPLPPDPMQARLMWMMPLVFSVMFFFFPAGLVLYWITNNTLTIAQQAFINKQMGVPLKFNLPKFK